MKAYAVAGNSFDLEMAKTAVSTTRDALKVALPRAGNSLGLCHGLAGNADILLHAARHLEGDTESHAVATAGAAALVHSVSRGSLTQRLESPSLMVGAAGVGYFLLRLLDDRLPSVLAIGPHG